MRNRVLVRGLTIACVAFWSISSACPRVDQEVRAPAVAGQFYPSDPAKLKLAVQRFLKDAVQASVEKPLALVVPHAGYIYSGQIAADAYRQASGRAYDVVVILGTNHTSINFAGISVWPRGAYQTPLGEMPVDESVAAALLAEDKNCTANLASQLQEHSVEVQVPFIQVLFPAAKIVPVVVGRPDLEMCTRFGAVLAKVLKGRKPLIVASSDLSHYPAYEDANKTDRKTLSALVQLDPKLFAAATRRLLSQNVSNLDTCACGEAPILAAIAAAKSLGATRGVVVSYANSGDAAIGDRSRVVGYGAVVLTTGPAGSDTKALNRRVSLPSPGPLSASDRKALLALARETISRFLSTETMPLPRGFSPRLQSLQGAFVTLRSSGELRGCIGHMPADFPLAQTVGTVAAQAAFNDPRFKALTESELPTVEIEISVLTPMKPVASADSIQVGRDGVVLVKGNQSAVFLPHVAVENKWGRDEMLDNLCLKAGLPRGAWKQGAHFLVFQAEVFSEAAHK